MSAIIRLAIIDRSLTVQWDDGLNATLPIQVLRDACPCATCNQRRNEPPADLPVLTVAEAAPVQLSAVEPVGNYAYGLSFSDGHSTGIYTVDYLRQLSEAAPA